MKADVVSLVTWDRVRDEYSKLGQMGWQSVLQAIRVGEMLMDLKRRTPHGEFNQRAGDLMSQQSRSNLMRLAGHRQLLERRKPDSQRAALKLIPKTPRKPSTPRPIACSADADEPTPKEIRAAFFTRTGSALGLAQFGYHENGPVDRDVVAAARACAAAWEQLARELEARL